MKQHILPPCIAFLVLALCCPALGAEAPESITVSVGGVQYRLLVPKGYRHLPETAPEYPRFKPLAEILSSPQQVLAIFVDERTLPLPAPGSALPRLKYAVASTPINDENKDITKAGFTVIKKMFAEDADPENLRREIQRNEKKLGLQPGDASNPALPGAPTEYVIYSDYMPLGKKGLALGLVAMMTVVDKRLLSVTFCESTSTPDTLDALIEEVEAHARHYIEAGLVVFAPEE